MLQTINKYNPLSSYTTYNNKPVIERYIKEIKSKIQHPMQGKLVAEDIQKIQNMSSRLHKDQIYQLVITGNRLQIANEFNVFVKWFSFWALLLAAIMFGDIKFNLLYIGILYILSIFIEGHGFDVCAYHCGDVIEDICKRSRVIEQMV